MTAASAAFAAGVILGYVITRRRRAPADWPDVESELATAEFIAALEDGDPWAVRIFAASVAVQPPRLSICPDIETPPGPVSSVKKKSVEG